VRVVIFCHSIISDWNHGNAHFLRGIASDLIARGHDVDIYEPHNAWSIRNLLNNYGDEAVGEFHHMFPQFNVTRYEAKKINLDAALEGAELVLVHEWNDPKLVSEIGAHRAAVGGYKLLFHDTHHRALSDAEAIERFDLKHYDGVLAFGEVIRKIYLRNQWTQRVWTWHEAADTRVFHPIAGREKMGDLVWIGNWGDDERERELEEFLIEPVEALRIKAAAYGVRYPRRALRRLEKAGIEYKGWLPNYQVPGVFAQYKMTVHVPRRPYVESLPGIPTIRPFEAIACGIPLVCSPWDDSEHLFTPGADFLTAMNGDEMRDQLDRLLTDKELARRTAEHGLETIRRRHTCAHRVDELMAVCDEIDRSRTMTVAV
jgi:spore maturation protein CgeB